MPQTITFHDLLDAADALSLEEKETLIDILHHRIAENGRRRVIGDVQEARGDFAAGSCQESTVDNIMRDILE
jgi:hypothetical protein